MSDNTPSNMICTVGIIEIGTQSGVYHNELRTTENYSIFSVGYYYFKVILG